MAIQSEAECVKPPRFVIVILSVFIFAGCFVFGFGVFLFKRDGDLMKNSPKTTGVITRIEQEGAGEDASYCVYVTYSVDGVEYKDVSISHYDSMMKEGKEIDVYYDAENHGIILAAGKGTIGLFAAGFGMIFLIFAIFSLRYVVRHPETLTAGEY
ncbi:MAG: DUF3592 domain-containing protein [Clostridiales bacterium]|jgi:hypothetical protein|nr:DUF3592 domain-containing protein [Clostridiales bacterium]